MSSSTQVNQKNDNQKNDNQKKGNQKKGDQANDDQEVVARQSYDKYMGYRREQVKGIEKQTRSSTQQGSTC